MNSKESLLAGLLSTFNMHMCIESLEEVEIEYIVLPKLL